MNDCGKPGGTVRRYPDPATYRRAGASCERFNTVLHSPGSTHSTGIPLTITDTGQRTSDGRRQCQGPQLAELFTPGSRCTAASQIKQRYTHAPPLPPSASPFLQYADMHVVGAELG
ncbi:hypothetical protein ACOMHN_021044 [Nucella lapillus]